MEHESIEITVKTQIHPAIWVMQCPKCGAYAASASERRWLPGNTWCNGSKPTAVRKRVIKA